MANKIAMAVGEYYSNTAVVIFRLNSISGQSKKKVANGVARLCLLQAGPIHKLQRAMGHSSLNVSLTYLRGLEVAELEESDMPSL